MPSGHNVLTLSIVHLSEQMTLDKIWPPAAPNGFSQSDAREAISPGHSNVITQKSYKRACARGPTVQSGAYARRAKFMADVSVWHTDFALSSQEWRFSLSG